MITTKEAVLIITKDNEPVALVRRDEASRKTLFYAIKEMALDDVEGLLKELN